MALKIAFFFLRPRAGTLLVLYLFLIESVVMILYWGDRFVNSYRNYPIFPKNETLVFLADVYIMLMSAILVVAIIYVSYNKPSITILSVVNAVLLLELVFKTYADFNYTFDDHYEERDVQRSFVKMMFRIIFTLYAVLVIHGFTIELKNEANPAVMPSAPFTEPQCTPQPPQYPDQPPKY